MTFDDICMYFLARKSTDTDIKGSEETPLNLFNDATQVTQKS